MTTFHTLVRRYLSLLLAVLSLCALTTTGHAGYWMVLSPAATTDDPTKEVKLSVVAGEEFQQDWGRVESFRQSKDLNGLQKVAEELQQKSSQRNEQHYSALMLQICQTLTSYDYGISNFNRQYDLAQKYAKLALQKVDKMPLQMEMQFVLCLMEDPGYKSGVIKGEEWSKLRSEKAKLLFHPWQRLEKEIDRNYDSNDPKNRFFLNVAPRPSANPRSKQILFAGMSSEEIEDPETREAYKAALKENGRKALKSREQHRLRDADRNYSPIIERYLIEAYSRPPYNVEELRRYLDTYVTDQARKQRILSVVTKNTAPANDNEQTATPTPNPTSPPSPPGSLEELLQEVERQKKQGKERGTQPK